MKVKYVLIDEHELKISVKLGTTLTGNKTTTSLVRENILQLLRFGSDPFESHSISVGPHIIVSFTQVFDNERDEYLNDTVKAELSVIPDDRDPLIVEEWRCMKYTL